VLAWQVHIYVQKNHLRRVYTMQDGWRESNAGCARRRFMQVEKCKSQLASEFNLSKLPYETTAREQNFTV
jgi:hypothetical protein